MQTNRKSPTVFLTAITSGASTLIVALMVGWLTLGRHAVGREEVIELIDTRTPYVAEQQALHDSVGQNTVRVNELALAVRDLERQGHRVEAKLDLLLSQMEKEE